MIQPLMFKLRLKGNNKVQSSMAQFQARRTGILQVKTVMMTVLWDVPCAHIRQSQTFWTSTHLSLRLDS